MGAFIVPNKTLYNSDQTPQFPPTLSKRMNLCGHKKAFPALFIVLDRASEWCF